MTDRELFEKALQALEEIRGGYSRNLIAALRERLAQPEPAPGYCPHCKQYTIEEPMRREWVGLTEEEELMVGVATGLTGIAIRMIEAKLREKNNV